jgi:hypothetical protein
MPIELMERYIGYLRSKGAVNYANEDVIRTVLAWAYDRGRHDVVNELYSVQRKAIGDALNAVMGSID